MLPIVPLTFGWPAPRAAADWPTGRHKRTGATWPLFAAVGLLLAVWLAFFVNYCYGTKASRPGLSHPGVCSSISIKMLDAHHATCATPSFGRGGEFSHRPGRAVDPLLKSRSSSKP